MLEGHAATNTLIQKIHFRQGHSCNTGRVLCVDTLIRVKWKTPLKKNRLHPFAYNTRATGISSQRVVHAGLNISRFIFHSALMP